MGMSLALGGQNEDEMTKPKVEMYRTEDMIASKNNKSHFQSQYSNQNTFKELQPKPHNPAQHEAKNNYCFCYRSFALYFVSRAIE
jgi:hypothetical protein